MILAFYIFCNTVNIYAHKAYIPDTFIKNCLMESDLR